MGDGPHAVILAAGQGKRMRSALPKILHPLGGRPLILHVVDAVRSTTGSAPVVVIARGDTAVRDLLGDTARCVDQEVALGTGDALRSVPETLRGHGPVLVVHGDSPLLRPETLRRLLAAHASSPRACTLLLGVPADPSGMGRVIRDEEGHVLRIVEEADLPPGEPVPMECNAGVYVFDGAQLWPALERLSTANAQREYYLTEVIALLTGPVEAVVAPDPDETLGINDRRQLAAAETVLRRRTIDALMLAGVTFEDPATTYVDAEVVVGRDSVIHAMTTLRGATALGAGCEIGPMAVLTDVRAGDGVIVGPSLLEHCELGDGVRVGPYCRVRPNTVLASGVELGTHAEVKNSTVGAGTRISHFSCVLDSDVGEAVNIGAGTVTCNYDGEAKHRTTIGDRVFVGTNSTLVAPVRLGDGSYIGAGSFVDHDVPPGALAVGRSRQRNIEGWAARRPSGS
ncbi:MAG TPA: bifunctional UDP-N-acetylglucosamine diphosphorylase/glucosamine-1-phosphate N-acetyltransferase GlmU [Candidatus Saccharimonadales bacterium]|nr:bifunctional UDP-N-acetylglucosamine diphosphorylase/glucosamine-1-phosphate N-acetyltransferase GlmU [Candidatus Saccharimonadales bacterium]